MVALPPDPLPIPEEERAAAIQRIEEFMERAGRIDLDYDQLLARTLPALEHLATDDQGRLWVGRLDRDGVLVFDVFRPDGTYLAVARCDCVPYRYFVPSVRGDQFLTVVRDEMEVPFVVRARITQNDGATR